MSGSESSAPHALPATPPEPLSFTLHRVSPPDLTAAAAAQRTRAGRIRMLLVLAICASPVVASYCTYFLLKPQGRSNYGALIDPPRPLPDLVLTTLDGAPSSAPALRGQWLLVAVAPPDCPDRCESTLLLQRQLREMLGRERDRVDKVWLVTGNGTVAPALRAAIDAVPAVTALRADGAEVERWLEPEAGQAIGNHLYLVDPQGHWMMRMPAEPEPARVKRDLERLLRAAAGWDRPGR